ncbi:MAG TPA: ATP-binding cassette domain-containing protein, partial [Candidatus Eisenbacteria bacterium]|nr:ATP-binding cassette domain-containing protein [Candidatus Eisenbacteria bacterium]
MTGQPLLEAKGLVKTFGRVQALRGASFAVHPGEVVALIGDNGAGKTVLVECLSGVLRPDAGEIAVDGRPVDLESPLVAMGCGIETVHQDLALADDLDAPANLYLGRELLKPGPLGWLGILDRRRMRAEAPRALDELGVTLQDPRAPVVALSGGERQGVALARSVMWVSKVVLLDEPAAALGVGQRRQLLDVVRRLRDGGVAVVYVSHSAPEALEVADRIEV